MNIYVKLEELATGLNISPSTLKKYYLLFEDSGYRFKRSDQGKLMFSPEDADLFRKLIKLKNQPGMTVQSAIAELVSSMTGVTVYEGKEEVLGSEDMALIKEYMAKQEEITKLLLTELRDTKAFVQQKLEERDKALEISMKETEEAKKLVVEKSEEEEKWKELVVAQQKKWWHVFVKN